MPPTYVPPRRPLHRRLAASFRHLVRSRLRGVALVVACVMCAAYAAGGSILVRVVYASVVYICARPPSDDADAVARVDSRVGPGAVCVGER